MRNHLLVASVIGICSAAAPAVRANTAIINPIRDNTLYEDAAGSLSNGQGEDMFIGETNQIESLRHRRALVKFDIAGSIPAGSTITTVTFTVTVNRSTGTSLITSTLQKMSGDWGEGVSNGGNGNDGQGMPAVAPDVTWTKPFFGSPGTWTNVGGDFSSIISGTTGVGGPGTYTFPSTAQMVADVQGWLTTPATNFGWVIRGDETSVGPTSRRIYTREAGSSNRPKLIVTYTPPAAAVDDWMMLTD